MPASLFYKLATLLNESNVGLQGFNVGHWRLGMEDMKFLLNALTGQKLQHARSH